jgi:ribonuclease HI
VATVFQSELFAIILACEFAEKQAEQQIHILTDSQAAILAISHPQITSQTVLPVVDFFNKLAKKGKIVQIHLVRGHNDTDGNDLADFMAKTGAALPVAGPEPFLPLSNAVCKQAAKEELLYSWTVKWQRSRDYRQSKIFFPAPNSSNSKNLLQLTRRELGILVRHLTGFSYLMYPQSLQQPQLDPTCRLCGENREESHHIIRTCPALARTLYKAYGKSH